MNTIDITRFWNKVDKTSDCWIWKGAHCTNGYGQFCIGKTRYFPARISYEITYGEIPVGMAVYHKCKTRACVNPKHLFLGSIGGIVHTNLIDRFWEKVDKKSDDECWNWIANVGSHGYGQLSISGGRVISAHRLSWEIHFSKIPMGLWVLHRCDNKKCVNPGHLFLGTNYDNTQDKVKKGRQQRGEASPRAKLKDADIIQIRSRHIDGESCGKIAKDYFVSPATIYYIIKGINWKHV